jgi:hypothetical protein
MVLLRVESTSLEAVGYDFETRVMAVEFKPGKKGRSVYTYQNVEPETAAAIVFDAHPGTVFSATVRKKPQHPATSAADPTGFELAGPNETLIWVEQLKAHRRAA